MARHRVIDHIFRTGLATALLVAPALQAQPPMSAGPYSGMGGPTHAEPVSAWAAAPSVWSIPQNGVPQSGPVLPAGVFAPYPGPPNGPVPQYSVTPGGGGPYPAPMPARQATQAGYFASQPWCPPAPGFDLPTGTMPGPAAYGPNTFGPQTYGPPAYGPPVNPSVTCPPAPGYDPRYFETGPLSAPTAVPPGQHWHGNPAPPGSMISPGPPYGPGPQYGPGPSYGPGAVAGPLSGPLPYARQPAYSDQAPSYPHAGPNGPPSAGIDPYGTRDPHGMAGPGQPANPRFQGPGMSMPGPDYGQLPYQGPPPGSIPQYEQYEQAPEYGPPASMYSGNGQFSGHPYQPPDYGQALDYGPPAQSGPMSGPMSAPWPEPAYPTAAYQQPWPAAQYQPRIPMQAPTPSVVPRALPEHYSQIPDRLSESQIDSQWPYAWMEAIGGDQYGVASTWYTNLGLFAPIMRFETHDGARLFFQGSGLIAQDNTFGGSFGLLLRSHDTATDYVVGGGLWYDFEESQRRTLQQFATTLELLGPNSELRLAGHYPFGDREQFTPTTPVLAGNGIAIGSTNYALAGSEIELGIRPLQRPNIWLFAGYYYYAEFDDFFGSDSLQGWRGRMEWRHNQHLTASVNVSHDDVFGTQVFGGATIAFRHLSDLWSPQCDSIQRVEQLARRRNRITTVDRTRFAADPNTGRQLMVVQVNGAAAPGGNGTPQAPFSSIRAAATAAGPNGIIFVRGGDFNETVQLQRGQRLLADGLADCAPHMVSTDIGVIRLPDQQPCGSIPTPSITSGDPLATVQILPSGGRFADGVEVAGFNITNTVGSGIVGVLNNGVQIHDNDIHDTPGYGIALLNASGSSFSNRTSSDTTSGVFWNTLRWNGQGGLLIADVPLNSLATPPATLDPSAFNVSVANRGAATLEVANNTIRNNARDTGSESLSVAIRNATRRDDTFGVLVAGLTDNSMTVNFNNNMLRENGMPGSVTTTTSSGGLGVHTADSANLTVNVADSTFQQNYGRDVLGLIGGGPVTTSSATLDLRITNTLMENSQLARTSSGLHTGGLQLLADTGSATATLDNVVITGDPVVLSDTYQRMDGIFVLAENDASAVVRVLGTGTNPAGRGGSEITGWNFGVFGQAANSASVDFDIANTLVDAERILKFHSGETGVTGGASLNAVVRDSELVARLATTSPLDGVRYDAIGDGTTTLSLLDTNLRFEGTVDGMTPVRHWLRAETADNARSTLTLDGVQTVGAFNGFTDFLYLESRDDSAFDLVVNNSTIGATTQDALDLGALQNSVLTATVTSSDLTSGSGHVLRAFLTDEAILSATIRNNTLTSPTLAAISTTARADAAPMHVRHGLTIEANTINATGGATLITSHSQAGLAETRVNLAGNTATGTFQLDQVQIAPGQSTLRLFDDGLNSSVPVTSGAVTPVASELDITFP